MPSPSATRDARLPQLPSLDGLRALAVMAVIAYHGEVSWMQGGFLGVEVFFVVSGFLITSLLLRERQSTGGTDLRRFWIRRARRLLPALWVLLVVVGGWSLATGEAGRYRAEILAAFGYVTNWYLILRDASYFTELGRPSPLRHLWSLAVEEQFYLLWPIAFIGLVRVTRRRPGRMVAVLLAGAAVSTALMAVLYTPGADPTRVYYGTDTRAAALLIGAALAVVWRPWKVRPERVTPSGRAVIEGLAVAGMLVLALVHMRTGDQSAWLYRGGFALVSVVTALVILAVTHPLSVTGRLLGIRPLREIGVRSYGLYLWHWPIFVITRPGIDVTWSGPVVWTVRLGLTALATELSWRLVEVPARSGAIGRWWAAARERGLRVSPMQLATSGAAVVVAIGLLSAAPGTNEIADSLRAGSAAIEATSTVAPNTSVVATTLAPPSSTPGPTEPGATTIAPPDTTVATTVPTTAPPPPPRVTAVGDSVMLGAAPALQTTFANDVYIDAKVSRPFRDAQGILSALAAEGRLGAAVVIHLGNNGAVDPQAVDALLQGLSAVPRVVLVNVKVPRKWESEVNTTLASEAPRFANVRLVDWKAASQDKPEIFYKDGIHLRPAGAQVYAQAIADAVNAP